MIKYKIHYKKENKILVILFYHWHWNIWFKKKKYFQYKIKNTIYNTNLIYI